MKVVEVNQLNKSYADVTAVEDLSFDLNSGEILGLIGPNGAGKSSTIKMILDFIKPDSGEIRIFGEQMNEGLKDRIGYLPEERGLYKRLTAIELILYLASLKGLDKASAEAKADELLRQTGMLEYKNRKNKEMSKGMGQLIQFIVTVIHGPDLIILDEPFSGLDPVRTEAVQSIIANLRDEGKAVILSTHQMNKVEELCNRVLMIDKGQSLLYGDLIETREKFRRHSVQVVVEGEIGELPGVIERKSNNHAVELFLAPDTSPSSFSTSCAIGGWTSTALKSPRPRSMRSSWSSLEVTMHKTFLMFKHEFLHTIKGTGFIILTFIVPVLALLAIGVFKLVTVLIEPPVKDVILVGYVDEAGIFSEQTDLGVIRLVPYQSREDAALALVHKDVSEMIIIPADYISSGTIQRYTMAKELFPNPVTIHFIESFLTWNLLKDDVPQEVIASIVTPLNVEVTRLDADGEVAQEQGNIGNIIIPATFALLLSLSIMIGSSSLIGGLGEEKESRLIEVLFSSVSIRQLLYAKNNGFGHCRSSPGSRLVDLDAVLAAACLHHLWRLLE